MRGWRLGVPNQAHSEVALPHLREGGMSQWIPMHRCCAVREGEGSQRDFSYSFLNQLNEPSLLMYAGPIRSNIIFSLTNPKKIATK